MLILTAVENTQPDYIALAMVAVLALIVVIMAIRKKLSSNKPAVAETVPVAEVPKEVAPGSAGELKLHDVSPKTAAMLMAIVADKTGKPLNELRFTSIKEVKE